MRIGVFGSAGFIGINLLLKLKDLPDVKIHAFDTNLEYFPSFLNSIENITLKECAYHKDGCYDNVILNYDYVFDLISTNTPRTSNNDIYKELHCGIAPNLRLIDACCRNRVKRFIFISSGGAIYGPTKECPIKEDTVANPISTYGLQKLMIEKLLYIYKNTNNLDYKIIRLSNPYGPFQRPNGKLGVVTTFIDRAIKKEHIKILGDGSTIRDYIYIDDAINAILNVSFNNSVYSMYNIGSGVGISIKELVNEISNELNESLIIDRCPENKCDVPINILDTSRYEKEFGAIQKTSLRSGIKQTASFLEKCNIS